MPRVLRIFQLLSLRLLPALAAAQQDPASAHSNESAQTKRPRAKIGVALEGGGALGLAHIGILEWFEDHHIPIDYIAGTSMGGLVGGLYATGKSPQQLEDFVREQDWAEIVAGETPYEDLSFRRKEDQGAFQNSIVLGLRHRKLSVG